MKRLVLLLVLVVYAGVSVTRAQLPPSETNRSHDAEKRDAFEPNVLQSYGKLPLSFEANVGQADPKVAFLSRSAGRSLSLSSTEAVLTLAQPNQPSAVRMKLVAANTDAEASAQEELPGKINYFIGNDPMKWHANVRTHAKVRYEGVYPGIDLVYYGNEGRLEYDFVVSPGANPKAIALSFDGVGSMSVDSHGDLVLTGAGGELRWKRPVVYQQAGAVRQEISGRYVQSPGNQISFEVGSYDRQRALVIDPVLEYSTYLGFGGTSGNAIAVDAGGHAYVTGGTGFFTTQGGVQPGHGGGFTDAFVTKLSVDGSALVYSTYLGGDSEDSGTGIAVDAAGNVYVTGATSSNNFPTLNALQPARGTGNDAFITKLSPSGSTLVYSTYLGASGADTGKGIAVDASGNAYIAGTTSGSFAVSDFPVVNAFQSCGGNNQAFAAKLNPTGSAFVYVTCLGGDSSNGNGIASDSAGNAYIVGQTGAVNFPATSDFPHVVPTESNPSGFRVGGDAFVVKLNPTGSARVYAARIGHGTEGFAIAVDGSGNAHITGKTSTPQPSWEYVFPTVNALQPVYGGGLHDAFVTKLNAAGTALLYSTYLGGSEWDTGMGIAVDPGGNAYISGSTASTDFPTLEAVQPYNARTLDPDNAGALDAFIAKLTPAGGPIYSTYLGGTGLELDSAGGIAADASGSAYVTGSTESLDFPVVNAFQTVADPYFNAFIAKITSPPSPSVTLSATSVAPGATVTATIANGPGNAADWVGLYPALASSTIANRLSYQYLNGQQSAPVSGVTGAILTFVLPSAGNYQLRFFLNNSLTVLAMSVVITVADPSVTVSATTVAPGATVSVIIANGPGHSLDWVGLFATGAPAYLSSAYLSGTLTPPSPGLTGATLTFTLPVTPGMYEVRFLLNNTYTVLATSAPITVAAVPTVTLSATTVAPGATVSATIANGPGHSLDWVGLYATGAQPASYLRAAYLNGTLTPPVPGLTGGTVPFTLPLTPGTYEVRFFLNDSFTMLVTSATITVAAAPTVTLSATNVAPGATVSATIANGPGNALDWVGLFATGAPPASYLLYGYLNGAATPPSTGLTGGTVSFALPLTPGTYQVRFFLNDSFTVLVTSATITVAAAPTVTLSATNVAPGATVSATIANGPGNARDWVGLYATGAPPASYLRAAYLNGTLTPPSPGLTGGTVPFTLPLTPGTYQLRFFLNDSFTVLVTSATITVVAPTVTLSATNVAPGAIVSATIANGPGNSLDWVGLFATGAPPASYLRYGYLNGAATPPSTGLTGGTVSFTLPTTPGTYQVRFFLNDSFTVLATSATITVVAPTVTLSATNVAPGATVSATIANGPGHSLDWVGLYATGAPPASYLRAAYLNGTLTPPSPALTGGTVPFTLPLTPGTYQVRFFLNDSFTVLMTSATITVQ